MTKMFFILRTCSDSLCLFTKTFDLDSGKAPGLHPFLHLCRRVFMLSRHPLCPSAIHQLSLHSTSTLLHPYVMKFAAQESHLRQSCFCRRENPTPTSLPTTSSLGHRQAPRIQAKSNSHNWDKGWVSLLKYPGGFAFKKNNSKLITFQPDTQS